MIQVHAQTQTLASQVIECQFPGAGLLRRQIRIGGVRAGLEVKLLVRGRPECFAVHELGGQPGAALPHQGQAGRHRATEIVVFVIAQTGRERPIRVELPDILHVQVGVAPTALRQRIARIRRISLLDVVNVVPGVTCPQTQCMAPQAGEVAAHLKTGLMLADLEVLACERCQVETVARGIDQVAKTQGPIQAPIRGETGVVIEQGQAVLTVFGTVERVQHGGPVEADGQIVVGHIVRQQAPGSPGQGQVQVLGFPGVIRVPGSQVFVRRNPGPVAVGGGQFGGQAHVHPVPVGAVLNPGFLGIEVPKPQAGLGLGDGGGSPGDDVDDAGRGISTKQGRARAPDDLHPFDGTGRQPFPEDAVGPHQVAHGRPVHHEQGLGAGGPAQTEDGPESEQVALDVEPRHAVQDVFQAGSAGGPDVLGGDHRNHRRRLGHLLLAAGGDGHLEVHQLVQAQGHQTVDFSLGRGYGRRLGRRDQRRQRGQEPRQQWAEAAAWGGRRIHQSGNLMGAAPGRQRGRYSQKPAMVSPGCKKHEVNGSAPGKP